MTSINASSLNKFIPVTAPPRIPALTQSADPFVSPQQRTAQLRDAATRLVSSALVQPALASMHDSPLRPATGPFAPSTVEKRFSPMLDEHFADRITKAGKFNLIDRVISQFSRNQSASVNPQVDHFA